MPDPTADYANLRASYDRVAQRYAIEIGGELAAKPLDRALLRALVELLEETDEATGGGLVADIGCGPGHVADYLTSVRGMPTVGIDLSPAMIEVGHARYPHVQFRVGSMLELPAADGEFLGAIAFYSVIHLRPEDRPRAYAQFHRVIRPGGWLLVAFHTSAEDSFHTSPGDEVLHLDDWWGEPVDLDFHFLDPAPVVAGLEAAGFTIMARTDRQPWPGVEAASRRCYLLCRRSG